MNFETSYPLFDFESIFKYKVLDFEYLQSDLNISSIMRCCNKLSLNDLVAGLFYVSMIFFLTTKTTSANPIHTNGWRTNLEKFRLMDMGDGETFIYGKNRFLFSKIVIKYKNLVVAQ